MQDGSLNVLICDRIDGTVHICIYPMPDGCMRRERWFSACLNFITDVCMHVCIHSARNGSVHLCLCSLTSGSVHTYLCSMIDSLVHTRTYIYIPRYCTGDGFVPGGHVPWFCTGIQTACSNTDV
jgi:hypothetical protein